jgi:hypothetical protein
LNLQSQPDEERQNRVDQYISDIPVATDHMLVQLVAGGIADGGG